jgi:hypothetical protein
LVAWVQHVHGNTTNNQNTPWSLRGLGGTNIKGALSRPEALAQDTRKIPCPPFDVAHARIRGKRCRVWGVGIGIHVSRARIQGKSLPMKRLACSYSVDVSRARICASCHFASCHFTSEMTSCHFASEMTSFRVRNDVLSFRIQGKLSPTKRQGAMTRWRHHTERLDHPGQEWPPTPTPPSPIPHNPNPTPQRGHTLQKRST